MHGLVHWAIAFAEANAPFAYVLALILAAAESLPLFGAIIPGTTIIVALAALIAAGALAFWPYAAAVALGAVLGDSLSYALGHHYQDALLSSKLLSRHRELLARGAALFHRHGGKSIFISRFTPGVRAVIPILAGILRMRPLAFLVAEIPAAIIWAVLHTLFGVLIGASLELLGAMAGRLAVLAGLLIVLVYVVIWVSRAIARRLPTALATAAEPLRRYAAANPGWLAHGLSRALAADRAQAFGFAFAAALIAAGVWLLIAVLAGVVRDDPLARLDGVALNAFAMLRSSPADGVMRTLAASATSETLAVLAVTVLVALVLVRDWPFLAAWILGLAGAAGLGFLLRLLPYAVLPGTTGAAAIMHNWGAMLAATAYGLLGLLYFRAVPPRFQALVASAASLVVVAGAVARLYLGLSLLSTEIVAIAFGLTWVGIAAAVAVLRSLPPSRAWPVALASLPVLLGAMAAEGAGYGLIREPPPPIRVSAPAPAMTLPAWRAGGWDTLPGSRVGLLGNYTRPFTVQWAGSTVALEHVLAAEGWQRPPDWNMQSWLHWLVPDIDPASLPVLPRFAEGRPEALILIRPLAGGGPPARLVLRLWPSNEAIVAGGKTLPLWLGILAAQHFQRIAGTLTIARTDSVGIDSLVAFAAELKTAETAFYTDKGEESEQDHRQARTAVVLGWDAAALAYPR